MLFEALVTGQKPKAPSGTAILEGSKAKPGLARRAALGGVVLVASKVLRWEPPIDFGQMCIDFFPYATNSSDLAYSLGTTNACTDSSSQNETWQSRALLSASPNAQSPKPEP